MSFKQVFRTIKFTTSDSERDIQDSINRKCANIIGSCPAKKTGNTKTARAIKKASNHKARHNQRKQKEIVKTPESTEVLKPTTIQERKKEVEKYLNEQLVCDFDFSDVDDSEDDDEPRCSCETFAPSIYVPPYIIADLLK